MGQRARAATDLGDRKGGPHPFFDSVVLGEGAFSRRNSTHRPPGDLIHSHSMAGRMGKPALSCFK
jgi:hypothetical protein